MIKQFLKNTSKKQIQSENYWAFKDTSDYESVNFAWNLRENKIKSTCQVYVW